MILLLGPADSLLLGSMASYIVNEGGQFLWLTPRDLVCRLRVSDSIDQSGKVTLGWSLAEGPIDTSGLSGVLNCVHDLPASLFASVHEDDREYARDETRAYLNFAFRNLPNVVNPPRMGSLAGCTQSLPFQWQLVTRYGDCTAVPRHYYGPKRDTPIELAASPNLVLSPSLFAYRYWKTGAAPVDLDLLTFAYERPEGTPVLATFIDGFPHFSGINASLPAGSWAQQVEGLLSHLAAFFAIRAMQVLLFVDERTERVTYGSASAELVLAPLPEEHRGSICRSLHAALTLRP